MRIPRIEFLVRKEGFGYSDEMENILEEIKSAISSVTWPPENDHFVLNPVRKGNGVVPIKKNCMGYLVDCGWILEKRIAIAARSVPGPIDAVKEVSSGQFVAVEWETGNISSTHRALNKMAIGMMGKKLAGGFLILPSRKMYTYLTDRIGNFAEIEPYFPLWRNIGLEEGVLGVIEIEHDRLSTDVPLIGKGTDGRALR